MAEKTGIAWTDHTFNPWWGCIKISPGCEHCYAETFAKRTGHDIWGPAKTASRRLFGAKHWQEPYAWNEKAGREGRARVFCASMADIFEDHPQIVNSRRLLWGIIRETPLLDWQILTKRPENIRAMLPDDWGTGYRNVWLGTSVEDQRRADERIPHLLAIPATVHFLSCEPLLGPVDLTRIGTFRESHLSALEECVGFVERPRIDWVIVGGESGGQRRPMELAWLEQIVNACTAVDVAVFVKQDNAFKPDQRGRIPDDLWIREFPKVAA